MRLKSLAKMVVILVANLGELCGEGVTGWHRRKSRADRDADRGAWMADWMEILFRALMTWHGGAMIGVRDR
jgi:hypothetical protein